MSRLFVAAWLPAEIVERLAALPRPDEPGVRWVRPDQWHVTLRFLGDADPDEAAAVLEAVRAPVATATLGPRVARLGRKVVCVPVAGLDEIAAAVQETTAHIGEPPDPRPFNGHITLARLKDRAACGVTGQRIEGTFDLTEIHLVASTLRGSGPSYEVLTSQPLL